MKEEFTGIHKEASSARMNKDEKDIESIVRIVSERMVNPFEIEKGASVEDKQPLVNIATSTVAPQEVANSLCGIRKEGEKRLKDFLDMRISSSEVDFFAPIQRPKLKTFASQNKPIPSKQKQKSESLNTDRQLFSKLTVIAQAREVNVHEV